MNLAIRSLNINRGTTLTLLMLAARLYPMVGGGLRTMTHSIWKR